MAFRTNGRKKSPHVSHSARIGSGTEIGIWTRIDANAVIGRNCQLGDWAPIGEGAVVGQGSVLGPYARVGKGASLGEAVLTGSHTRIARGVRIRDGAVLGDCDLVLSDRIIPNLCSGYALIHMNDDPQAAHVSMVSGNFLIPDKEDDEVETLIRAHFWGDEQALEPYRISGVRPSPIFNPPAVEPPSNESTEDLCAPEL